MPLKQTRITIKNETLTTINHNTTLCWNWLGKEWKTWIQCTAWAVCFQFTRTLKWEVKHCTLHCTAPFLTWETKHPMPDTATCSQPTLTLIRLNNKLIQVISFPIFTLLLYSFFYDGCLNKTKVIHWDLQKGIWQRCPGNALQANTVTTIWIATSANWRTPLAPDSFAQHKASQKPAPPASFSRPCSHTIPFSLH